MEHNLPAGFEISRNVKSISRNAHAEPVSIVEIIYNMGTRGRKLDEKRSHFERSVPELKFRRHLCPYECKSISTTVLQISLLLSHYYKRIL